jgi:hypothetical protein
MSTNHSRDDWADARLGDALHRALDGLAGQAAAASDLDGALGSVRTRVRRRRAAKKAGLGVTTLAVAGGLVVGGSALAPWQEPQVLPGPAETPSPSQTVDPTPSTLPSETPSQEPSEEPSEPVGTPAVSVIEDGHQPSWVEGTAVVCGAEVADLVSSEGFTLEARGPLESEVLAGADGTEETTLLRLATSLEPRAGSTGTLIGPTLLWSQDGRIVDVGLNVTEEPVVLDGTGATVERDATDWTVTTCAAGDPVEGGMTSYTTELPGGDYEVRAYYVVWNDDFSAHELVLSDPVPVTVPDEGWVR